MSENDVAAIQSEVRDWLLEVDEDDLRLVRILKLRRFMREGFLAPESARKIYEEVCG